MLKTNSKQVKETIKNYIMDHFRDAFGEYFDENGRAYCDDIQTIANTDLDNYTDVCNAILVIFWVEKCKHDNRFKAGRASRQELFIEWVSGLCSPIDSDYYYNVSAVDLLGSWLDDSDAEKSKYSEADAEKCITNLLWRELNANATRTGVLY